MIDVNSGSKTIKSFRTLKAAVNWVHDIAPKTHGTKFYFVDSNQEGNKEVPHPLNQHEAIYVHGKM
jgi:hypothetical protein